MTFDMNDAEPQKTGDVIPDGTFAKVTMILRPGGIDGESEIDRGLLKRSATEGSDVLMLDAEFTIAEGPHIRRKFWQTLTVSGGKVDENGVSIGARITKSTLRAMIDSALGLNPEDMSEATKTKRILRGFADQTDDDFEVVVADDGSGAATAEVVERWTISFEGRLSHVWQGDAGFRLARVRNLGALATGGDYIVFTDGDCIPRRGFIAAIRRAERDPAEIQHRQDVRVRQLELEREADDGEVAQGARALDRDERELAAH